MIFLMLKYIILFSVSVSGYFGRKPKGPLYYTPNEEVRRALEEANIIPELLPYGPEFPLQIKYGDDKVFSVNVGDHVEAEHLMEQPVELKWPCRQDAFHTIIVTGLDVPSREDQKEREWRHWIHVNVPANNISGGQVVVPYAGPGLSYENGIHRIVYLIYEQPWRHTISFSERRFRDSPVRPHFSSPRFVEKYDLGDPQAVNFFYVHVNNTIPDGFSAKH